MSEQRFTDREVARILERAAELDRRQPEPRAPSGTTRPLAPGLTVAQLQEIGVEVGIPPELIARAASEVRRPAGPRLGSLLGPPPMTRQTRSVPVSLSRGELAELIRVVDERVPAQGTVTEALDTVRWVGGSRFLDRQVVLEPRTSETLVQVEERYGTRVRVLWQALPPAYALMIGLPMATEGLGLRWPAVLFGAVVLAATAWALGRLVWGALARRSDRRTGALAEELAEVAGRIARRGSSDGGDGETRPEPDAP